MFTEATHPRHHQTERLVWCLDLEKKSLLANGFCLLLEQVHIPEVKQHYVTTQNAPDTSLVGYFCGE